MKEIKEVKGVDERVVIKIFGAVFFVVLLSLAVYSLKGIFQETRDIFPKRIKTVSVDQSPCLPSEHAESG